MNIVLFDGVCNLCNGAVQYIIRHDKQNLYKFAALQSDTGRQLVGGAGLQQQYLNTIVLIENDKAYVRSTAVLKIARHLSGPVSWLYVFMIVPAPIRDFFYNIVAKYRYNWFGQRPTCMVPDENLKQKFLG